MIEGGTFELIFEQVLETKIELFFFFKSNQVVALENVMLSS